MVAGLVVGAGAAHADDLSVLQTVITAVRSSEQGYKLAADLIDAPRLKTELMERASERTRFLKDLHDQVPRAGGRREDTGTASERGGWVGLRSDEARYDVDRLLEEIDRGEQSVLDAYRTALHDQPSDEVRAMLERQRVEVERAVEQIRRHRDARRRSNKE
jgi:uncharacterized protein (TIGR02284 family)